jgi:hypothetical protein
MRLLVATILISTFLSGCAAGAPADGRLPPQHGMGVLGRVRPKASMESLKEVDAQEQQARDQAQQMAAEQAQPQDAPGGFNSLNGLGRLLPGVSTEPFAPAGEAAAASGPLVNPFGMGAAADANSGAEKTFDTSTLTPAMDANPVVDAAPAIAAQPSYTSSYMPTSVPPPPPGAVAGGLVPPPPAVTLSTNAAVAYGGDNHYVVPPPAPYNPYMNPYANPYMNPYAMPPYQQMPPPQQQMPQQEPQRPALFGGGKKKVIDEEEDEEKSEEKQKQMDFVPIRPTGMEARSPYKQRDDIKVLWNGMVETTNFQKLVDIDKGLSSKAKLIAVGLPTEPTKGTFTISPRHLNAVFHPVRLGKKVDEPVRKMQFDLVQSYYRYLFSYNKFAIAQQTVAARKQETEVASSMAEKQRAAADMARAQEAAESAKEDMRESQYELASIAGSSAARTIIGKVSGVTPGVNALAQAESTVEPIDMESGKGILGLGKLFGGGNRRDSAPKQIEDEAPVKVSNVKPSKGKSKVESRPVDGEDLVPSRSAATRVPKSDSGAIARKLPAAPASPISFELKDVKITARKSVLTVAIRNTGAEAFKVSPDVISLAEGNQKLSEAALRAEFDSTLVQPNMEVSGKITIFGRPWNDRLAVFISDGNRNVPLKRIAN